MAAKLINNAPRPSYAGRCTPGGNGEIWRLAVARVFLDRNFRRDVLTNSKDPVLAPPLEIGIDKTTLARIAQKLESREATYSIIFFVLLFLGLVALAVTDGRDDNVIPVLIAFLFLDAAVSGYRNFKLHRMFRSLYRPTEDNSQELISHNSEFPCIGPSDQNVVIYHGFSPFDFAGVPLGGWSFAVDLEKKSDDSEVRPPLTREAIEASICAALQRGSTQEIEYRELLLVHGLDVDILPRRANKRTNMGSVEREYWRFHAPALRLSSSSVSEIENKYPKLARRYMYFSFSDWGGELVLSWLLRFEVRERILFVDHSRFLLAPSAEKNRPVSLEELQTWTYSWNQFVAGAFAGPFKVIFSPFELIGIASEAFSSGDKLYQKTLEAGLPLNYGASQSTRRKMMGDEFIYYAQRHDVDVAVKSFEKIVLETITSTLEDHGVDVSELRNKQTTIFNSGILVQSGDVTAQSLAVGSAAVATTSNSTAANLQKRSKS